MSVGQIETVCIVVGCESALLLSRHMSISPCFLLVCKIVVHFPCMLRCCFGQFAFLLPLSCLYLAHVPRTVSPMLHVSLLLVCYMTSCVFARQLGGSASCHLWLQQNQQLAPQRCQRYTAFGENHSLQAPTKLGHFSVGLVRLPIITKQADSDAPLACKPEPLCLQ